MNQKINKLSEQLEKVLGTLVSNDGKLYDAARYSLFTGGKRSRPLIALLTALDLGVDAEDALIPAAALEMIHTYSLIHDDLPCMDDDDLRRGKATLHKVTDEATAVLTGDFLLTRAFESIAEKCPADKALRYIQILTKASGGSGMIGGQIRDLEHEERQISVEELKVTHILKTGALIQAALLIGATAASADDETCEKIEKLGKHLGLAVQILNDLEDIDEGVLSDQKKGKATYVSLLGYEGALGAYAEEMESANKIYDSIHWKGEALQLFLKEVYPSLRQSV